MWEVVLIIVILLVLIYWFATMGTFDSNYLVRNMRKNDKIWWTNPKSSLAFNFTAGSDNEITIRIKGVLPNGKMTDADLGKITMNNADYANAHKLKLPIIAFQMASTRQPAKVAPASQLSQVKPSGQAVQIISSQPAHQVSGDKDIILQGPMDLTYIDEVTMRIHYNGQEGIFTGRMVV